MTNNYENSYLINWEIKLSVTPTSIVLSYGLHYQFDIPNCVTGGLCNFVLFLFYRFLYHIDFIFRLSFFLTFLLILDTKCLFNAIITLSPQYTMYTYVSDSA